jgi:hypothetical protein
MNFPKKTIFNLLLGALYIYYFIEIGKVLNSGSIAGFGFGSLDGSQSMVTRLILTIVAPICDTYFWLLNVVNYFTQSKALASHLAEMGAMMNLGNQWSSTGFKYFLIAGMSLQLFELITTGEIKDPDK